MQDDTDDLTLPGREASATIVTESATKKTETPEQKAQREADEKSLKLMRKQLRAGLAGFQHFRENALDDAKFRAGTWGKKSFQWVSSIQSDREAKGKAVLTINRAPGFIHQVTNQARQANLRIRVNPVGDKGDPKIAETLQGIIRNIEVDSFADRAYARASDKQAEIGFGVFRLLLQWADEYGVRDQENFFRQVIRIKGERDPLRIILDPTYDEPDASDANFAFKIADIDRVEWKNLMNEDAPSEGEVDGTASTFEAEGIPSTDWFPNGKIRYVEWFNREPKGKKERWAMLSDGTVIPYPTDEQKAAYEAQGITIDRDRWIQKKVIVWRKCTALKIYETTFWSADAQPWIPVVGDELEIDGERDYRGVIRDSKDSARAYNAEVSALVEAVSRSVKAPFIGYRGQFGAPDSTQRKAWEDAHLNAKSFLEVEPMDIDGKPAPFPQAVTSEPPLQGIIVSIRQTDEDYKSTAGFHDASLGQRGPQESGVAIDARKQQDTIGSSHYLDNLRFALCAGGRQLIQLIRATLDVPTVMRITGDDDQEKSVMVFSGADNDPRNEKYLQTHPGPMPMPHPDGQSPPIQSGQKIPFQPPKGVTDIFDLSVGDYHVEVSAGQDPGTRRQESVEAMGALFKALPPEYSTKFMDLYFLMQDHPVAQQMAERAKKMLPPEFQDDDQALQDLPPAAAAAMAGMKAKLMEAMQQLQQAQAAMKGEKQKLDSQLLLKREEIASRERVETLRTRARLIEQQVGIHAEKAMALLDAEIARLAQLRDQQQEQGLALLDASENANDRQHDVNGQVLDAALAPPPPPPPQPGDGSGAPPTDAPPADAAPAAPAGDAG